MKYWLGFLIATIGWIIVWYVSKVSMFSFEGAMIVIAGLLIGLGSVMTNE